MVIKPEVREQGKKNDSGVKVNPLKSSVCTWHNRAPEKYLPERDSFSLVVAILSKILHLQLKYVLKYE